MHQELLEAFNEGKRCDLRGLGDEGFGVSGIVGDTYGLLEEIYSCCGCVAAFQSTSQRSIYAGRVQSNTSEKEKNRHGKIKTSQGVTASGFAEMMHLVYLTAKLPRHRTMEIKLQLKLRRNIAPWTNQLVSGVSKSNLL